MLIPKHFYTQKARDIYNLQLQGLYTPVTLILNEFNQDIIINYIRSSESTFHYYRISKIKDVITNTSSICDSKDLIETIRSDVSKLSFIKELKYEIIVQPLINFDFSGVALIHNNYVITEIVIGHPISLLRQGEIKYRFLFDKSNNLIDINQINQTYILKWVDKELVKLSFTNESYSIDKIITAIRKIVTLEPCIFEFGVIGETLIYLESKSINKESYTESIDFNGFKKPFIVYNKASAFEPPIYLERPLLESISLISPSVSFEIGSGPYLAHFATYCAAKSINCSYLS